MSKLASVAADFINDPMEFFPIFMVEYQQFPSVGLNFLERFICRKKGLSVCSVSGERWDFSFLYTATGQLSRHVAYALGAKLWFVHVSFSPDSHLLPL